MAAILAWPQCVKNTTSLTDLDYNKLHGSIKIFNHTLPKRQPDKHQIPVFIYLSALFDSQ